MRPAPGKPPPRIEFRRPRPNYPVEIALVDGRPVAKASFYFASQKWLVTSLGAGFDFGHGRIASFETIAQARKAIVAAMENVA